MKWTSMEGRLALLISIIAVATAGAATLAIRYDATPLVVFGLAAAAGCFLGLFAARAFARPIATRIRALATAVTGLGDGDFAIGVVDGGGDEMAQLIASYNEVGEALRSERQSLHQRELLLDTVIQSTPVAMVLLDPREKVVYANTAGRQLLNQGRKLEGAAWGEVISQQSPEARPHLDSEQDGLFAVEDEHGDRNVYLLTQKGFLLNGRPHRLILLQTLTRELNRQEVATWKKVIRVISHELNNSIAPIKSLAHSGRRFAGVGELEKLDRALNSITDRAAHLAGFIEKYARFARIPEPTLERVPWDEFFGALEGGPAFSIGAELPERPGRFDRTLLEQVMINLYKNAHEAGSPADEVTVTCRDAGSGFWLEVADRGPGMQASTLGQALVPFYSTKQRGSGIGLSLCREIVEAHEGRLSLANRSGGGLRVRIFLPG